MGWFDEAKPKRRRKAIPQDIRLRVWNKYFPGTTVGKCYVCKDHILLKDFQVGHNKADAKGGSLSLANLRPICSGCNRAMGTTSIEVYKAKYYGKPKATPKTPKTEEDSLAALEVKVRKHLSENDYGELSNRHGFDLCAIKEGGLFSADRYVAVQYNQSKAVSASEFRAFLAKTAKFSDRVGRKGIISPEVYGLIAYTGELPKDVAALARGTRITLKKF